MTPTLHWTSEDLNNKRARKRPLTWSLWAGQVHVASVTPSNGGAFFHVYVRLYDVPSPHAMEEEKAKAAAERMVSLWFEHCYRESE